MEVGVCGCVGIRFRWRGMIVRIEAVFVSVGGV